MEAVSLVTLARRRVALPEVQIPAGRLLESARSRHDVRDRHAGAAPRVSRDRAAARPGDHRPADLVPRDRGAGAALPRGDPGPALARPGHPGPGVLARRLRRRRGRPGRRARPGAGRRRRLLDGLDRGATGLAPAPRHRGRAGARRDHRPVPGSAPPSAASSWGWAGSMLALRGVSRSRTALRAARAAVRGGGLEPTDLHAWALRELRSTSPWAVGQALAALGRHHSRPWIGRVDVPTAVVVMMRDRVVPTPRQIALARAIPGATIHEVDDGHAGCVLGAERFVPRFVEAAATVNARRRDLSRRPLRRAGRARPGSAG
ncbi:hypothetical protein [Nocardioides convexus]|uniref:hypothetical protein n=1 Tax=Nocardioides convexus TaxID=2712224 RepID=UPI0024185E5D|nr:hypothetical protein [Nocardioides convexus]